MSKSLSLRAVGLLVVICALVPILASAHEVYILDTATISDAVSSPSPNPLLAYIGNEGRFFFWGFVAIVVTLTVFFATTFRLVEARTFSLFARLKRLALPLARLTAGATLITFGLTGFLYGPEIPFESVFGGVSAVLRLATMVLGAAIALGFQTRLASALAFSIFVYAAATSLGTYTFNYIQYAGAYLLLIILGGGAMTIDHRFHLGWHYRKQLERLSSYAFPLLRVSLGASIIFASFYAKFLHSNLALEVVSRYGLEAFFPFDPLFIVLGAFIIEFLAGFMLLVGFEIRWTALFLLFWLTLAHLYFPEAPWVHLSLYGFGLAIFCHGYDRFTVEGRFFKRHKMEPVL